MQVVLWYLPSNQMRKVSMNSLWLYAIVHAPCRGR